MRRSRRIRHVQYGMAATLVLIVLLLNLAAILIRARVAQQCGKG